MKHESSILITGGTGSFGRAFVEALLNVEMYDRICIYSRDEYKQSLMQTGDERLRFFVGDVRDYQRLRRAMQGVDVVVHAAALKRIEVGKYNPDEMVKTNILGAMNVIEAAHEAGVKKVVGLSTDKAYQPISPYGQSKALAESLFLAADDMYGHTTRFAVTRYGNVAGSTGSVIPRWRAELQKDEPAIQITDPDCTRFWMSMAEAVDLVFSTIVSMEGGELNIPRSLPAYQLRDLATAMDIPVYDLIGLPDWEKKHECMDDGLCSNTARRMTVDELREALRYV